MRISSEIGAFHLRSLRRWSKELGHSYAYYGGMYRDGVGSGAVLVTDKEWWQNWESMVGFLNGYILTGNKLYYDMFEQLWIFVREKFMNYNVGESRQLLDRQGTPLVSNMGNPWKGIYHTGRALAECIHRLDLLIQ